MKLRHTKVETEMKSQFDLYSDGSDSADYDAGQEIDEDDQSDYVANEDDEEISRSGRSGQSRSSRKKNGGLSSAWVALVG